MIYKYRMVIWWAFLALLMFGVFLLGQGLTPVEFFWTLVGGS